MTKKFGFDLCCGQLLERISSQLSIDSYCIQQRPIVGDSPIESLLFFALANSLKHLPQEWFYGLRVGAPPASVEALARESDADRYVYMERQVQIERWRVDYLLHVYATWDREPDGGTEGWKKLVIECDGHDFHERTKEQAARDRERDRGLQLSGFEVFRFTGSELWRDPLSCADQVIAWANRRV